MRTQKEQFIEYLKLRHFESANSTYFSSPRIPACYKTDKGNTILTARTCICLFDGADTKEGDLGCVTFYVGGSRREKYRRTIDTSVELFKKAFCPKDADEAIEALKQWFKDVEQVIKDYKRIV
jgi:hypothetical protein